MDWFGNDWFERDWIGLNMIGLERTFRNDRKDKEGERLNNERFD